MTDASFDVIIVGGGLGGLTTAALLAGRGLSVILLERSSEPGGRASTRIRDGFHYNEGAHALYCKGAASRILAGLGVRWTGRKPPVTGVAELDGRPHGLPATATSLLTTTLLSWPAKRAGARFLARLGSIDPRSLRGVPFSAWLDAQVADPTLRATLEAFLRVTTYSVATSLIDAGAAVEQIQLAQRTGVLYVDGGWQTLVDGTARIARAAGAVVRTGARVDCAVPSPTGWTVSLAEGTSLAGRGLVLATGPAAARSLVASDALARWVSQAIPVRTACLDVALSSLPRPKTTFALGIDRPLYLSVHSASARLAPPGKALVSAMKYLAPGPDHDPSADLAELEGWLDRLQPGWRDVLLERRWLPAMVTSNALVTAQGGGMAGRPGPRIPDAQRAFVVGDWVGQEGMLVDASLASAERAARELVEDLALARVA